MKKTWLTIFGCLLMGGLSLSPVAAQTSPTINLTVDSTEVSAGDEVVFNVTYRNNDEAVLENGKIRLDLSLQSGLTVKSSSPPLDLSGSQPFWRLPAEVESGGEGVLSLTVLVGSNYAGDSINTSGTIEGQIDSSSVSNVSNAVGVQVVTDDADDDDDDEGDEDGDEEDNSDESDGDEEDEEEEEVDLEELQSDMIEQNDVANIVGVLDLPEGNINAWDSRYLIIGAAAFVLILSAGIIAFFLGRKSR